MSGAVGLHRDFDTGTTTIVAKGLLPPWARESVCDCMTAVITVRRVIGNELVIEGVRLPLFAIRQCPLHRARRGWAPLRPPAETSDSGYRAAGRCPVRNDALWLGFLPRVRRLPDFEWPINAYCRHRDGLPSRRSLDTRELAACALPPTLLGKYRRQVRRRDQLVEGVQVHVDHVLQLVELGVNLPAIQCD